MHFFVSILIFLFCLFFYIHLQYQFKTSNDLEIYELDYTTNKQLQEILHLKQPTIFQIDLFKDVEPFFRAISTEIDTDVIVKDIRDYYKPNITSVDGISLSFSSAKGLMETDPKAHFFSENNWEIMREISVFSKIDSYLASPWILQKKYDLLFGSKKVRTPLKFHTDTSRFLIVSGGFITIKMTPWNNRKHLEIKYDYENYEFWSPINIWNTSIVKCLEFEVKDGFVIYIPPYWLYSIEFTSNNISVASFTYSSGMNIISNLPNYTLYFLQQNNIQHLGELRTIINPSSSKDEPEAEPEASKPDQINEMLAVITPSEAEVEKIQ